MGASVGPHSFVAQNRAALAATGLLLRDLHNSPVSTRRASRKVSAGWWLPFASLIDFSRNALSIDSPGRVLVGGESP